MFQRLQTSSVVIFWFKHEILFLKQLNIEEQLDQYTFFLSRFKWKHYLPFKAEHELLFLKKLNLAARCKYLFIFILLQMKTILPPNTLVSIHIAHKDLSMVLADFCLFVCYLWFFVYIFRICSYRRFINCQTVLAFFLFFLNIFVHILKEMS